MDRSPGFGSYACNCIRALHTRFPCGSVPEVLNLAAYINSPDRSTKSTTSTLRSLCACKHKVSGSLSLPSRGSFLLSLTVLCAIGHWLVFSLGGWSPRLPTGFLVSRGTPDPARSARLSRTRLSLAVAGFPKTVPVHLQHFSQSVTPGSMLPGLGSSAFARRY